MKSYLNIVAGALFIIWIVEYFGYNAGENIHILLILSIILVIIKTISFLSINEKA